MGGRETNQTEYMTQIPGTAVTMPAGPLLDEFDKNKANQVASDQRIRASDPTRRRQLAEQIQVVVFDEVPFVPWGQYVQASLYRKRVRGVLQFPAALLWNVWLDASPCAIWCKRG